MAGALGSPGFVAPEVILHGPHTPAMDVFSLGIVLFIMLVGRKPFNIPQCEDLSYCQLPLADAPGLQDPRRAPLPPLRAIKCVLPCSDTEPPQFGCRAPASHMLPFSQRVMHCRSHQSYVLMLTC